MLPPGLGWAELRIFEKEHKGDSLETRISNTLRVGAERNRSVGCGGRVEEKEKRRMGGVEAMSVEHVVWWLPSKSEELGGHPGGIAEDM